MKEYLIIIDLLDQPLKEFKKYLLLVDKEYGLMIYVIKNLDQNVGQ